MTERVVIAVIVVSLIFTVAAQRGTISLLRGRNAELEQSRVLLKWALENAREHNRRMLHGIGEG